MRRPVQLDTSKPLSEALTEYVDISTDGTRLPTVRELMQKYGVGQASVQTVFALLKEQGLISATVGRGTYVTKKNEISGASLPSLDSVLILSNSNINERCLRVQNTIVEGVRSIGGKVVQISYHDTEHLLEVLKTLPRFDAAVLQSHYESIPIRLFSLLKDKAGAIVVDGLSVAGVDVDRIGIDWEEAMALGLSHLTDMGHRRIALISLNSPSMPILLARRFFGRFDSWNGHNIETRTELLEELVHPSTSVEGPFGKALDALEIGSPRGPTAVMVLGVSDGSGVVSAIGKKNLTPGKDMDVVILGHTDIPSEHLNRLTIAGGKSGDGAEGMMRIIQTRLDDPAAPAQVVYIPTEIRVFETA